MTIEYGLGRTYEDLKFREDYKIDKSVERYTGPNKDIATITLYSKNKILGEGKSKDGYRIAFNNAKKQILKNNII